MKKNYERYIPQLLNGVENFVMQEKENFPSDYDIYQRTVSEYISFISFYNDSNRNVITHLSNERKINVQTLETIKELINQEEYILAQYHIVALQLYFDIEVKLKNVLATMILQDMNINSFLNIKKNIESKESENYERIKKEDITDDNKKGKRK